MKTKVILVYSSILLLLLINSVNTIDEIKLTRIGDKLVFISDYQVNWYKAMQACTKHGMQLLTIKTAKENGFLDEFMQNNKEIIGSVWTSGNDLGAEGNWVWMVTGEKFQYNNWSTNEPSNTRNRNSCDTENCLEVGYNLRGWERTTLWWNDYLCNEKNLFICEQRL